MVLIKPFEITGAYILDRIGNPCRENLRQYAKTDIISCFIIKVNNELLPVCAIPIANLLSKCVCVSLLSHSYIVNIPNNYEHH